MKKNYLVCIIALLILVLSLGIQVKRAVSDIVINHMMSEFGEALRAGDTDRMLKYMDTPQIKLAGMTREERNYWADIFDRAVLIEQDSTQRVYQSYIKVNGYRITLEYTIKLHRNGEWKIDTGLGL